MKKLIFIVLSLFMIVSFVSCKGRIEPAETGEGHLVISDQKGRFSFEVPDTWTQGIETGDIAAIVTAPEAQGAFTSQVTVSIQAADENLFTTEKSDFESIYRMTYPDVTITEFTDKTVIGEDAIYLVANYTISDNEYVLRQYVFNAGDYCYFVSLTSAKAYDAQYQNAFQEILNSFEPAK